MIKALTSRFLRFAAAVAILSAPLAHAQYKVIKTVKVGGDGGYDYVTADSDSRRLYIARSGATGSLHVYNLDTLAETGTVPTGSAHGAIVDDSNHHGFATSKPVTMFDSQTLAVIKTIDTKSNPDGFLLDAAAHTVYILSHSAPQLTAIDTATGNITGTLDIAGAVEQSVLDGHGNLYLDLEDKDSIAVVDTGTLKLERTIDISSRGGGCSGLAIDAKNGILFAACNDKENMIIVDAASGKIITTLPIGTGCDGSDVQPCNDGSLHHAGRRHVDCDQGELALQFCRGTSSDDATACPDNHARYKDRPHLHRDRTIWSSTTSFPGAALASADDSWHVRDC